MKWQSTTIGELVDAGAAQIQTGPFGTQLKAAAYVDEGIPVINVRNIGFGSLKPDKLEYLNEETVSRLSVHLLKRGDIVFGRKGAVDRHLFVREEQENWMQGSDCIRLRLATNETDPQFLSYLFLTESHQKWMLAQCGNKATMASLNHDVIERISVRLPKIAVQKRIVEVLSHYDILIENNLRRIKLLEDSARLLYEEWFVRLRFPGHEHVCLVKGVPEGWDTQILDDLCRIGRGASPRPIEVFMGGEVPWFKIADATASESPFIFDTKECVTQDGAKKSIMLDPGSLILSNSATCGIPYFTAVAGCIHDGWLHFSDLKRVSQEFLYCFLQFKRDELVSSVGDGSTQKNLNTAAVGRLKIAIPRSNFLLTQFDETLVPIFSMIQNLATQNQRLRSARDILLPKLMSGEIKVENTDARILTRGEI